MNLQGEGQGHAAITPNICQLASPSWHSSLQDHFWTTVSSSRLCDGMRGFHIGFCALECIRHSYSGVVREVATHVCGHLSVKAALHQVV